MVKREQGERKREPTDELESTVPINMPPKVEVGEWRGMKERGEKVSWIHADTYMTFTESQHPEERSHSASI